ncbi:hypothetical protein ARMGADRAFT_524631 [Armillaria gallica]|uniref:Uncharacterized protein n=1 Tax=Armillaria gallica TaxID=47427 RepID=A0A2H3E0V7_ARMGA|nr:hypothetical protein ARMGADRAFT_524631 [Armillaria gallica]
MIRLVNTDIQPLLIYRRPTSKGRRTSLCWNKTGRIAKARVESGYIPTVEIMRIPPGLVAQLKQELGLDGKEPTAMTFDEKRRLVEAHRWRTQRNLSSSSNTAMTADGKVRLQFSFLFLGRFQIREYT